MENLTNQKDCFVVGTKQTIRALEQKKARVVYLAQDASEYLKNKIILASKEADAQIIPICSMKELGQACAIDIGAACAAILIHEEGGKS